MAIAGRVAIVPKGDWSADATYKRLDAVTYNNTLYFAKKDVPAGTATSNTEYWSKSIVGSVVTVDDTLSPTSTNPVQNKVVTSNLTDLKYGEVAGGKNLIDVSKVIRGEMTEGNVLDGNNYITDFIHLEYGKNYILSNCYKGVHETAWFTQDKTYVKRTFGTEITPPTNDCYYARIEYGIEQGINAQLEEGTQATSYEPYIPSVKMLAEENAQQSTEMMDIKMLGWSVPRELPIQNEVNGNQFVQKVGRVDLGSLNWQYNNDSSNLFYTNDNLNAKTRGLAVYNKYKGVTGNSYANAWEVLLNDDTYNVTYINASGYTDSKTLRQDLTGVYLYYELATPITKTIDGNEVGETVGDVIKETTVNLLKPTLQTTTTNGVTCTNNGDGTYTLNGTATSNAGFNLIGNEGGNSVWLTMPADGKIIYAKGDATSKIGCAAFKSEDGATMWAGGIIPKGTNIRNIYIAVWKNNTLNNVLIKPMLTTNLSATYEDFVPYTGDTGKLNGDVAALKAEKADHTIASIDANGLMSKDMVTKLNSIADGANRTTVDDAMSDTSTNPVQNKVVTSNLVDLKKETTVNLLNPTLETTTKDGITCTNNGDGTYTLNGTVSTTTNRAIIVLQYCGDMIKKHLNENLLLIGCPKHDKSIDMNLHLDAGIIHASDSGNGGIFKFSQVAGDIPIKIEIGTNGTTVNNLVFKPMITTNLNATYDDFVPYTGDTGKLNGDVAGLTKKIPTFERNRTVFASSGLFLTGDTAGRFGAISDEWSDTYGREIQFSNAKDTKTHCSIWVDIPAHSVGLFEAYTKCGEQVVVTNPLFYYNKGATAQRETISCEITTSVGATATIVFNPIIIKNV